MAHTSGIYAISSILNKKIYIGYSKFIEKRWSIHRSHLNRGEHVNTHLQAAWDMYGRKSFSFTIIEQLSPLLTKQEYEAVETKWVLHYKSHQSKFGYNMVLPGSIPLYRKEENITNLNRALVSYVCIKEDIIANREGRKSVSELTGINEAKIGDLCDYWKGIGKRKSKYGWIIVRKEEYDDTFDYIGYKKKREWLKPKTTKTWKDYKRKEYIKKNQEDIIPYTERNLKRIPIIAVNISTGETISYTSIKESNIDFLECKVRKCIANEFGKYKHRGYYFKKAE